MISLEKTYLKTGRSIYSQVAKLFKRSIIDYKEIKYTPRDTRTEK